MARDFSMSEEEPAEILEVRMQRVSLIVSLAGLGLMFFGLIDMLFGGATFSFPGATVLPLGNFINMPVASAGLIFTSTGVILLGLLPLIRVALALWLYLRLRDLFSTIVAVIVVLELLASIRLGI